MKRFEPLQKVIRFDRGEPQIAWVIEPRWYGHMSSLDDKMYVRITCHEKEAHEGKGETVRVEKVHDFTPARWVACEEWLRNKADLSVALHKLATGKVTYAFQPILL